jgi:succinoglycan biosynthesis transport protein ExoP
MSTDTTKKPSGGFSAQILLDTIRLRPGVFVSLLVASLMIGAAVYFLYPSPKNTAFVFFQFNGSARVINSSGENATDMKSFQQVQSYLVKKREVLLNALKKIDVDKIAFLKTEPNPYEWLDKNLKIDFKPGPQVMRVYLEGDHPTEMKAVLLAVSDAYMQAVLEQDDKGRKDKLNSIQKAIKIQEGIIDQSRTRISAIAKELKSTDEKTLVLLEESLRENFKSSQKTKIEYEQQVEFAKRDIPQVIQDRMERLKENETLSLENLNLPEPVIPAGVVEEQLRLHPQVLQAEQQVKLAQDNLLQIQSTFAKGALTPEITKARENVNTAEMALKKVESDIRAAVKSRARLDQKQNIMSKVETYRNTLRKLNEADSRLENSKKTLEKHSTFRIDLENNRKKIAHNEKLLDILLEEEQRVLIEENAQRRVLSEEPYTMAGVEGYKSLRASVMSGGAFFALSFGMLVFWENRNRRVNRTEDLSSLGLQILGTLPLHLESDASPNVELMEAVDSTRTLLLRAHSAERAVRVMAVTSGVPGEGKTYLSSQLAISLARAGYRTLLVDGDVHAPRIHDVFKVQPGPGLCEVLRDEVPLGTSIQTCDIDGLFILPAGNWSITARQFLVGNRWTMLRKDLESQFDFVVIDTAPLLMMTDTMLLALRVDGVVLSVLAGLSRMAPISQTKERLESLGVRVLGVVVNGIQSRFPGYHYGPYANKYSGRYQQADSAPLALTPATDDRTGAKSS